MGIQVNSPWFLLLMLPWLLWIVWIWRSSLRLTGARKKVAVSIRALASLLVIILLADVAPYTQTSLRNVVFVADRSASMQQDRAQEAWITQAASSKKMEDQSAVVSTGLTAMMERVLSPEVMDTQTPLVLRTQINDRYTNLAAGLQQAASALLQAGGGRMVLISDGEENTGDVRKQARLLRQAGIVVDTLHMASAQRLDAAIEEFKVPPYLKQGEKFQYELKITSTATASGQLRLFSGNQEILTSSIDLVSGENRFVLEGIALESGMRRFRAELYIAGDEQAANNAAYALSKVSGTPSVLIVEGDSGSSSNLEKLLQASFIRYQTIMPEQLSQELSEYAQYDSIILNNVPATRISQRPMQWLAKAVKDLGIGLVSVGGEQSYGLGGYFQTPLEEALPVYMDLRGKRQLPSLGLVLVIDRSGSMDGTKMELAKEAAIRTVELLRSEDTVGIVAFDTSPWWVVEPTTLEDKDTVINQIKGIQPAGGTDIYPALASGYEKLRVVDTERKHIILLTDGQSAGVNNYQKLTANMLQEDMTMSTVAVGQDSDQVLLRQLAEQAKGRYYYTNDQSTIPAIFSREAVLISRTYIVNVPFTPSIGQAGNWSQLWQEGLPKINAYVAVTPKEFAETALWTHEGDPLLARWTYGSGRAVSWMSDVTGKWTPDWVAWERFADIFSEWVKWTFPQYTNDLYQIQVQNSANQTKLRIKAFGESSDVSELGARISTETGEAVLHRLMPVAPGEYELLLPESEPGVYTAQIAPLTPDGESIEDGVSTGFVVPYSPEYRLSHSEGQVLMEQVAEITGGRVLALEKPEDVYTFSPQLRRDPLDMTRSLLITILLLWLLDIAVRRISLPRLSLAGLRKPSSQKEATSAASADRMTRLKESASKRTAFYEQPEENKSAKPTSFSTPFQERIGKRPPVEPSTPSTPHTRHEAKQPVAATKTPKSKDAQSNESNTVSRLMAAKNRNKR